MVIGGATAPDYFFFILSRRNFFYLSQKAFFLSLADGADLADLYDRHMVRKVNICVICGICENTISSRAFYLSQEPFFLSLADFTDLADFKGTDFGGAQQRSALSAPSARNKCSCEKRLSLVKTKIVNCQIVN